MDGKETTIPRRRRGCALLASLAIGAAQALWAADPKIAFDIPAGEVSQAIIEFYKQTQVEILYASPAGMASVKTHAVVGQFEVAEALTRMLEGTGFTFEFENPHSILLKRVDAGTAVVEAAPDAGTGPAESGEGAVLLAELSSASAPQMQDVVVTGTFIHGVLDIMSPLVHVDRTQMKSTGYATVQDALQTLPFNSGAAPSDDFSGNGGNYNRGTAPNLRGLGYGATLVLVNGRRQPLAGSDADFVDTSNIPWSAVERIEVLPDGTSALYGSDAIAGVVNIVMRDDLQGAETQARFATALGEANEKVVSQLFGNHWDGGKFLLSYQFSDRTSLAASDRYYAANADKRPLGGTDHRSIWGSPGNILNPNTLEPAFAIPAGQNGTALTAGQLLPGVVNLHNNLSEYDLMPNRRMHSVFMNGSQKLGDHFELYGEMRLGQRETEQRQRDLEQYLLVPASNAFFVDPFGDMPFVIVAYSFLDDLGPWTLKGRTRSFDGSAGTKMEFGRGWRRNFNVSYGREDLRWTEINVADFDALSVALADSDPATAFNPFGDGSSTNPATLAAIRTTSRSTVASDIGVASFVIDGPVLSLPTGAVKLAVGVERREEGLQHHLAGSPAADFGRNISSAFTELSIPIMGRIEDPRSIPRLELSVAGRYESYSDFGNTFNPKIGLRWAPFEWAKIRTSWGTSFKAPRLLDLYDTSQNAAGALVVPDPLSATKQSLVLAVQGNNPDLKEETAETWSLGVDLVPASVPGLTLSLTYYDIDYQDRILRPGPPSPFDILLQEDQWAPVINRSPTSAQISEICNSKAYYGSLIDCLNSSPAAIIDFRMKNLSATRTRGVDLKLDYALDTRLGSFQFGLAGNRAFGFRQALTRTAPATDIIDTFGNPLGMRVRGTVEWAARGPHHPGLRVGATVDHTSGYRDSDGIKDRHVDALTTLDMRLAYRTAEGDGSPWNDMEFMLSAVNLLNTPPPFVDRNVGYDVLNADPIGRVVGLYVQKSW